MIWQPSLDLTRQNFVFQFTGQIVMAFDKVKLYVYDLVNQTTERKHHLGEWLVGKRGKGGSLATQPPWNTTPQHYYVKNLSRRSELKLSSNGKGRQNLPLSPTATKLHTINTKIAESTKVWSQENNRLTCQSAHRPSPTCPVLHQMVHPDLTSSSPQH